MMRCRSGIRNQSRDRNQKEKWANEPLKRDRKDVGKTPEEYEKTPESYGKNQFGDTRSSPGYAVRSMPNSSSSLKTSPLPSSSKSTKSPLSSISWPTPAPSSPGLSEP
jgi:hypothetical protein